MKTLSQLFQVSIRCNRWLSMPTCKYSLIRKQNWTFNSINARTSFSFLKRQQIAWTSPLILCKTHVDYTDNYPRQKQLVVNLLHGNEQVSFLQWKLNNKLLILLKIKEWQIKSTNWQFKLWQKFGEDVENTIWQI